MAKDLSMDIIRNGVCSVVSVEGDINWETSPEMRAAILELYERRRQQCVIIDLRRVRRIDSSGVSSLMQGWRAAKVKNARFVLTGLTESARRMLELTRLAGVFEIAETVDEALTQASNLQPSPTNGEETLAA